MDFVLLGLFIGMALNFWSLGVLIFAAAPASRRGDYRRFNELYERWGTPTYFLCVFIFSVLIMLLEVPF